MLRLSTCGPAARVVRRPASPRTAAWQFAAVKRRAFAAAANIDDDGRRKNATVQQILAAAGVGDAERASIAQNQVLSGSGPDIRSPRLATGRQLTIRVRHLGATPHG
jgi:hypothetical protein